MKVAELTAGVGTAIWTKAAIYILFFFAFCTFRVQVHGIGGRVWVHALLCVWKMKFGHLIRGSTWNKCATITWNKNQLQMNNFVPRFNLRGSKLKNSLKTYIPLSRNTNWNHFSLLLCRTTHSIFCQAVYFVYAIVLTHPDVCLDKSSSNNLFDGMEIWLKSKCQCFSAIVIRSSATHTQPHTHIAHTVSQHRFFFPHISKTRRIINNFLIFFCFFFFHLFAFNAVTKMDVV